MCKGQMGKEWSKKNNCDIATLCGVVGLMIMIVSSGIELNELEKRAVALCVTVLVYEMVKNCMKLAVVEKRNKER